MVIFMLQWASLASLLLHFPELVFPHGLWYLYISSATFTTLPCVEGIVTVWTIILAKNSITDIIIDYNYSIRLQL